jgi:hypothetical protein
MKTIETRLVNWIESKLNPPQLKPQPKDNILTDYLVMRLNRLIALRELARKEATECVREDRPYSTYKIMQADYLIKEVTARLNSRPYTTIYSMN